MKLEYFLIAYIKINSKWIKDLNVRPNTIKLRGKHRKNTLWQKPQKDLFDPSPRLMKIKTKINKWDIIKGFCTAKMRQFLSCLTVSERQRQHSEWEKIFANRSTDKRLISKIYK